jgi:DNA-binding Lrp family transcriptional regulator
MTKAYLFVSAKAGKTKEVAKGLAALKGVKTAHVCWGTPDIIVVVIAKDERTLNNLVLHGIQQLPGVEHTETHLVMD